MSADRLLAHYRDIEEAPDAIPRLRRFILDLAVLGKLVPQDPVDEPSREYDPSALAAVPFEVPTSWRWSRLSALGHLKGGGTPSKLNDEYWAGSIPWISPKDMKRDRIDSSQLKITEAALTNSAASLIEAGSLLFVVRGMILAHTFPVATAGVVLTINQDMKALVLHEPAMADYVLRALKALAPRMLALVKRSSHGTCRIEGGDYRNFPIPIPPRAEQRRIIAKMDELMNLCDRLAVAREAREATRDRVTTSVLSRLEASPEHDAMRLASDVVPQLTAHSAQIARLRATLLELAVRGDLTGSSNRSAPTVVSPWRVVSLKELLREDTQNGYSRRPDDAAGGIPILRISAGTSRRDGIVAEEDHKRIGGIDEHTRTKFGLRNGDLLACRFNGNKSFVGRLALFTDYLRIAPIYPDKLIRVRVDTTLIVPEFLRLVSESATVREQMDSLSATTVGNWGISATNLKTVVVPVPPIDEQLHIVAKVADLMALCDQLDARLAGANTARSRLLDALISEALAGPASETAA